jgi:beta-glucosidase
LDNESIFDNWDEVTPRDFNFFHWVPGIVVRKLHLQAGQPISVRVEFKWPSTAIFGDPHGVPITSAGLGWATLEPPANLASYDAVVITAGFDSTYEAEGVDRPYELPEYQDDLIQKMAGANLTFAFFAIWRVFFSVGRRLRGLRLSTHFQWWS